MSNLKSRPDKKTNKGSGPQKGGPGLFNSLSDYFRAKYGGRVQKITVTLPFTCPHGACDYCLEGSTPPGNSPETPLEKQIEKGIKKGKDRYGAGIRFMVYFQSYTNTNDTTEKLKSIYDTVLNYKEVIGIDVGTRPDCAPDGVLDLIASYKDKLHEVWVEFGLQSANDLTLTAINRGHNAAAFEDAVRRAKARGIKVTAHMIAGLPREEHRHFLKTAEFCAVAGADAIKIHPLHILRGTKLCERYEKENFSLLTMQQYVKELADIIEILPPKTIIMRFTAEGDEKYLVAPEYCRPEFKGKIKQALVDELKKRGTRQGSKFRS